VTVRGGIAVFGTALLIAGCGGGDYGGNSANDQEPRIRIANKYHEDLEKLPPNLQRIAMMRAIRDARYRCQRVDNTAYQEEYRNMRMWVAACGGEETKTLAIFIAANGDVQVRDCQHAGQLALPRCEGLPPAAPEEREVFKEGAADNAFRNQF
jgi:hypothetical protein